MHNQKPPEKLRVTPSTTRISLLERVRDPANHAAWRDFDARYGDLILSYCRRRGLPLMEAEDVRQMVMLGLMQALPGFEYTRERGRFRDYLGRAVRNAIGRYAVRHRGPEDLLDTGVLDALAKPHDPANDAAWESQWVAHHCRLALATLRESHEPRGAEILERLLDGGTIEQIAAEFDMTQAAVRKAKQRAKDRLREIVQEQIADEGFAA